MRKWEARLQILTMKMVGLEADDAKLVEKIFKRYLVDEYQEDERKVKLKPIKKDMQAFDALLYKPKDQYIKESNVTRNYDFFFDKIINCGLTLDELFETIRNQTTQKFKNKYRSVDYLLFDDVQFIIKKGNAVEEELFNTFEALDNANKQIVFTSDISGK